MVLFSYCSWSILNIVNDPFTVSYQWCNSYGDFQCHIPFISSAEFITIPSVSCNLYIKALNKAVYLFLFYTAEWPMLLGYLYAHMHKKRKQCHQYEGTVLGGGCRSGFRPPQIMCPPPGQRKISPCCIKCPPLPLSHAHMHSAVPSIQGPILYTLYPIVLCEN